MLYDMYRDTTMPYYVGCRRGKHTSGILYSLGVGFIGGTGGSQTSIKNECDRAPALLSLLQDLRTNIVKNTTVTVYELILIGVRPITARLILIY